MDDLRPISTYVLKIASRCNLNCTYCYMYNLTDKTYRDQPIVMCKEVVSAIFEKTKKHALAHDVTQVNYIFHGGEPLLAGQEFIRNFVKEAKQILEPEVIPHFSLQTNATLITVEWLDLLLELNVKLGISLDGTAEVNDLNRVDHQGKGSHEKIVRAIELIKSEEKYAKLLGGLLCVVNIDADPLETYRHFRGLGVKGADFRLPDATHDTPPEGKTENNGETPYADWLIPIFDEWFETPDTSFTVRLFENIIGLVFGSKTSVEDIGGRKASFVVIETNGGIEPPGALKACEEKLTKVGLNILTHDIDEVYAIPLFAEYLSGADKLCSTCQACPVVSVCGGGKFAHRYRKNNGFDNPSVYCADLLKLVTYTQERTINTLPEEIRDKLKLGSLADIEQANKAESAFAISG